MPTLIPIFDTSDQSWIKTSLTLNTCATTDSSILSCNTCVTFDSSTLLSIIIQHSNPCSLALSKRKISYVLATTKFTIRYPWIKIHKDGGVPEDTPIAEQRAKIFSSLKFGSLLPTHWLKIYRTYTLHHQSTQQPVGDLGQTF